MREGCEECLECKEWGSGNRKFMWNVSLRPNEMAAWIGIDWGIFIYLGLFLFWIGIDSLGDYG